MAITPPPTDSASAVAGDFSTTQIAVPMDPRLQRIIAKRHRGHLAAASPAPSRRAYPDRRVVEYGAAARRAGIGADQGVDAHALFEGGVRPD